MASVTFLSIEDGVDISENPLALVGGKDNRFVQDFRFPPVAYLAGWIPDIELAADILSPGVNNDLSHLIHQENIPYILQVSDGLKHISYFPEVSGHHCIPEDFLDDLRQIGTGMISQGVDHLFFVLMGLKVKKEGHGGSQGDDQPGDDFKPQIFKISR
jgi:hypothetical protein